MVLIHQQISMGSQPSILSSLRHMPKLQTQPAPSNSLRQKYARGNHSSSKSLHPEKETTHMKFYQKLKNNHNR